MSESRQVDATARPTDVTEHQFRPVGNPEVKASVPCSIDGLPVTRVRSQEGVAKGAWSISLGRAPDLSGVRPIRRSAFSIDGATPRAEVSQGQPTARVAQESRSTVAPATP